MKKFSTLFSLLFTITSIVAFAPPRNTRTPVSLNAAVDRKAFLAGAAASVMLVSTSQEASAKDNYSLDFDVGEVLVPEKKKAKSEGGGLVLGALFGSVALSLPFFLPNILRLLGVNSAIKKNPGE